MLVHECLENASIDHTGNVLAPLAGPAGSPALLLESHLDSVHPLGTAMDCWQEGDILYGPTVRHNSRAVAEILSIVRCIKHSGIEPASPVILAGTVREEGMSAMEGMKNILAEHPNIRCCVSLDGAINERITYQSTGFDTSAVTFKGIGGHAYGGFGKVANPLHAAARAVAQIADIQVPESPKPTFSVSVIYSGDDAGVHAIPSSATIKYNLRSTDAAAFERLRHAVGAAIESGCRDETMRWGKDTITCEKSRSSSPLPCPRIFARPLCKLPTPASRRWEKNRYSTKGARPIPAYRSLWSYLPYAWAGRSPILCPVKR